MNKTQKIIKTFFLTLFVTIVCMCSTVFAASEPIGSINYPIGLKTEYPFNFESNSSKYQSGNTKVISLQLIQHVDGNEAQTFIKSKYPDAPSATTSSEWHFYRMKFTYYSSSNISEAIYATDIISKYSLCNTNGEEVKPLDFDCYYINDRTSLYSKPITPNNSLTFNIALLLKKSDVYPLLSLRNYFAPENSKGAHYAYISLDPNKSNKIDICSKNVTVKVGNKAYTGKAVTPSYSLTYKNSDGTTKTLIKDVDYTVSYGNHTKLGLGTIKFKGKGSFDGIREQYFVITPTSKNIKVSSLYSYGAKLQWSSMYGAKGYKIYKYNTKTKKYNFWKDWSINTLYISDLKSATSYKYKIVAYYRFIDPRTLNYSNKDFANITVSFTTRPTKSKITKATRPARKTVSLTWAKSPRVSGYQVIVYKTYGLKNVVKTYYTKGTSKKVTGLTSGKWYYVAVRPYKTINGKKLYSDSYEYYYSKIK